jgi:hypothetical protein
MAELLKKAEAFLTGIIYLAVLVMGVALAALGAYTAVVLTYRLGEVIWHVFGAHKWL